MEASTSDKKRKIDLQNLSSSIEVVSEENFGNEELEGILSQSEDESAAEEIGALELAVKENLEDATWLESDETLSEVGEDELDIEDDESAELNYEISEDANGNTRYIYQEIDPVYDSDDSDAVGKANTIGNIPLSFYDTYPHIGYDINGKKIMRPAKGAALDALLESIELPKGWTGLTDPATGKPLELTQKELETLKRIQLNELPEEGYDLYPATVEYFTSKTEIMPLSAAPEPKRRFIPSKHEAKRVMKIVRAIREGRILPYKPPKEREDEISDELVFSYDIWAEETAKADHPMNIPAPRLAPPTHDASINPPPEYLPTKAEKKAWEDADESDREKEYLPTKYDSLRKVPGYSKSINERFERSLDLYLAPRVRRNRLNIDPESLLPKLPDPRELRPFPTSCATLFRGHEGRARTVSIDPTGIYLASGGDDGTVRVWELLTGRLLITIQISKENAIDMVRWRPTSETMILAAACGESVYLISPHIFDRITQDLSRDLLDAGWGFAANDSSTTTASSAGPQKESPALWTRPERKLYEQGVLVKISVRSAVKVVSWHRRGEYFATVSPRGQSTAVAIHTLSKHQTQLPFRRLKGIAQSVQFHPLKPILFVATQRMIRSYDLVRQELIKIIQPGARMISCFDIHTGGDNLIVGSYDRKLLWHDLDLSVRPYKTLRYHTKAIRAVRYHRGGLPLFADASDDCGIQVYHGKVVSDLMENATIVPLKVLRGHQMKKELGVFDLDWHPREPWLVSAGADGTCRLWT